MTGSDPAVQLHLIEQPADCDMAVLTCTHEVPLQPQPGWPKAHWCPTCRRRRAVNTIIRVSEKP